MTYQDPTGLTIDAQTFGTAAALYGRAVLGDDVPNWALDPDDALPVLGGTVPILGDTVPSWDVDPDDDEKTT